MASSYKLELARFSSLLIESKTEPSVARGDTPHKKIYTGRGGHRTEKNIYWKGGHRTYLIGVGTPHIPY